MTFGGWLVDVYRVSGDCLKDAWSLEGVWRVYRGYLKGVSTVLGGCLEGFEGT